VSVPLLVGLIALAAWTLGHAGEGGGNARALSAEGLILSRCEVCHSADLIRQQRLDRAKWEATVKKMIHWGADVSPEETAPLVDYLATRYHPGAPEQEPAHAPEHAAEPLRADAHAAGHAVGEAGRGEIVFAHNCQACHGAGATGGVGPKLAGNAILGDDERFLETVLHGRGAMPAWESVLSMQDIADVRAWLQAAR
jgi:cytochrome c oxidase cbb3-type subunit 3